MGLTGIQEEAKGFMSIVRVGGKNFEMRRLTPDECLNRAVELLVFLAPAFEYAAGEVDEVAAVRLCALGRADCFVGETNGELAALAILQLTAAPLKKICTVLGFAGRGKDFYWYMGELEAWALAQGAVEMRGYGREASMRLARRHGYAEIYRVFSKPLKGVEDGTEQEEA